MPQQSDYVGRKVALLTQYGKERVIAPFLEPGLGCVIEHIIDFDTDHFGTFTRETPLGQAGRHTKAVGSTGPGLIQTCWLSSSFR